MKKISLLITLCLAACATHQPLNGTAIDDMNMDLHEGLNNNVKHVGSGYRGESRAISKALLPELKFRSARQGRFLQKRFDIAVKDEPANLFFTSLVVDTPISIIVGPELKDKTITLNLKQVTVEQTLQALEDTYGFTYNRIPGGFEVLPNTIQTKIFAVNYLELQRSGISDMRLHSGEVTGVIGGQAGSGGSGSLSSSSSTTARSSSSGSSGGAGLGNIGTVETRNDIDFWKHIKNTLENMIGKEKDPAGRSVTVNPLAGVIVVRAYNKELKQVQTYLDMVQNSVDRQVILEVKILEVTLRDQYQMGIDWHIFGANLNSLGDFPDTNITITDFPPAYTANITWNKNFTTFIQMLETQGNVQVLSSPRVATMNNQKSLIKVGTDEFFVSGISPAQASLGAVAQPTEQISPFFSGITLDVTPQIDVHGDVTLHIHPSISLVTEQIKKLTVGSSVPTPTPLAQSTIRESDTIAHAKNGQMVIIGGLMQNNTTENIAQAPFFGNIPFLGTLVRATKQNSVKTELVILIKPTVVNSHKVNRDLRNSTAHLTSLKRGFHFGARPDIYGNEGEEPIVPGPKAAKYDVPPKRCKAGQPCMAKTRQSK